MARYEREIEYGKQKWYMATVIIVDRIGRNSRIVDLAKRIDGTIVQMSSSYWIRKVTSELKKKLGLEHEILSKSDDEIEDYLREKMQTVPLEKFIGDNSPNQLGLL